MKEQFNLQKIIKKTALGIGVVSAVSNGIEASTPNTNIQNKKNEIENFIPKQEDILGNKNNYVITQNELDSLNNKENELDLKNKIKEIQEFAKNDPKSFLLQASNYKDVKGLDLSLEILKASKMWPVEFLKQAANFKDINGLKLGKEILKLAEMYPMTFIREAKNYKDIDGLNLAEEISKVAEREPSWFLFEAKNMKDIKSLDLVKEILKAAEKDPDTFLGICAGFKNIEGLNLAENILKIGEKSPMYFLSNAENFVDIDNLNINEVIPKFLEKALYIMSSYNSINKEIKDLNLNEKLALLRKWEPRLFLKMAGSFKGINDINLSKEISSAAIEAPSIFISQAKNFKNINGFDLAKEIIKAAEREPSDFLLKASDFKDVENINLAEEISKAAEREPEFFIACNPILFENIKNFDLVHEVKQALKKESGGIFSAAPKLKDIKDLNLKEEIVKAAEINPGYFLDEASNLKWINGLNLKEEIVKAAGKDPESFLDVVGSFKDILEESEKLNLIEQSFKIFPEGIINHRDLLNRIENPAIESNKLLKEIINPQLLLLFHKMVNNDLSKDEASNIINNPNLLYKNLIEIKSIPDHLGSVSVENKLKDLSLRIIQQINSLHERPDIERFKSIENLDAKELYTTMVYGEQEIFTSSFNGLFNRLISKIDRKKGGIGGKELLDQVGENKFRTFIKECTGFNRLDEFLLTMDKSDADNLLIKIVQNLDFVQDGLGQAVTVADIFGNIQDKETIKLLQNQIKIEYEKISSNPNSNEKDQVIYGLLSSMFKNNTQINQDWFLNISKEYPIDKVTEVKSQELFNENGVCVQKYCFYESGDKDGVYSFDNFVNTYKNDPLWNIDRSHEGFIIITGKNGNKTVEIYANIPKVESRGMAGIDEMNEFLEKNKSKINVYTYRGHSFGFEIDGDISKASIVNVGSCGGYNNLSEVLAKSPHAQIISTQGTGSKFVNDPTLYRANKLILSGRDILWNNFVESLPDSLKKNKNFKDYVFPDKNQGMMFIKAYYKKLKEKE